MKYLLLIPLFFLVACEEVAPVGKKPNINPAKQSNAATRKSIKSFRDTNKETQDSIKSGNSSLKDVDDALASLLANYWLMFHE